VTIQQDLAAPYKFSATLQRSPVAAACNATSIRKVRHSALKEPQFLPQGIATTRTDSVVLLPSTPMTSKRIYTSLLLGAYAT
jgi:hypothetical protein